MKQTIESKLQLILQKIASSHIHYVIFIWVVRISVFILSIGKRFLIWFLRLLFFLIREAIKRYLVAAVVGLTVIPETRQGGGAQKLPVQQQETEPVQESSSTSLEWVESKKVDTESPLLPMVVKDRIRICKENLATQDRYGVFEAQCHNDIISSAHHASPSS